MTQKRSTAIKRLLWIIVLGLAGAWVVRGYMLEGIWIASGSMEPTLPQGTHYFVNKLAFKLREPLRGEIVVFQSPVDDQRGLIKRVIAVGGDRIEIRSKQVIVNGTPLQEPYAVYKRPGERLKGDNIEAMVVPAGHFFVLGDNRDESEDSTTWVNPKSAERIYFIKKKDLQGRLLIP